MEAKMVYTSYYGFMHHHKDNIKWKAKAHSLDQKDQKWVTYDNFDGMYNCVYEQMVSAGIAWKLEKQYCILWTEMRLWKMTKQLTFLAF